MRAYGYQEGALAEPASSAPVPADKPAVAFAEATPSEVLTGQLADAADVPFGELIAGLGDLVAAAKDLPSLQKVLIDTYGNLSTDRLTEIMAAAFALAELKGMAEVVAE